MKIAYVGPLWNGSTCLQRMQTLEQLGYEIFPVNTSCKQYSKAKQFFLNIGKKILTPCNFAKENKRLVELLSKQNINLLWMDKAVTIKSETLEAIRKKFPEVIIAGYSPDDMMAKHNKTSNLLKSLPFYDIYFTTKSFNVEELKNYGCPDVFFIGNAYDSNLHRPVKVSEEERLKLGGKVGFIGRYEKQRLNQLLYLAENGINIKIWGENWKQKHKKLHPNLKVQARPLWAQDYVKAICSFDINLAFLCKANRDLQTTRSVEIPACGAFMLAERTGEHLALFKEGREAEFFDSNEELLEKVRYYLTNDELRKLIAQAGLTRCIESGYNYNKRLEIMLSKIAAIKK